MTHKKTHSSKPSEPEQHEMRTALETLEKRSEGVQDSASGKSLDKHKSISTFEIGTLVLSLLAILAASISAYFVYGQLEEMRVGMRLDQRAWVGFSDEAVIPDAGDKDKFIKLALTIKNTGKTPALNVSVESITSPATKKDTPPTWEEIENNLHGSYKPSWTSEVFKEYEGPGMGYVTSRNKLQSNILAPGATQTWNYDIFHRKSDAKVDRLRDYFLVRITYTDIFSKSEHTTKICFMETINDTAEHCPAGNSMN
jgi:hypothetical protein